ncbi:uncharacterized protein LOC126235011 [Schistocerca nitens]|uniref:uncharacterized protein LOC126235011 n=1 Tax=Schistocerca nitens TaxID=7011 RepID=UPI0021173E50|nr:uncharacterized protein LOC126235011 [Schistocerca nitens]
MDKGNGLLQADIGPSSTSDDETMGPRRGGRLLSGGGGGVPAPPYSKQDIREQYCITSKQLDVLERHRASSGGDWLLGCLSSYQEGTCRAVKRSSLLSVCVRRRAPSDENLPELCRRPLPKKKIALLYCAVLYAPAAGLPPVAVRAGAAAHPARRELRLGGGLRRPGGAAAPPPPPPPAQAHPSGRPHKHVSFARSHTLTSFDVGSCSLARSRERLVDGKERAALRPQPPPQPPADGPKVVVLEKLKRAPMKTQATQTDVCLGRRPHVPNYLSLSPRTIHRVRMVSQFAQTNGGGVMANGRGRLMKSFSEAGGCFADGAAGGPGAGGADDTSHEPLQRTQSEEPPRSPFLVTTPRQILIDFEPAPVERRPRKRLLQKTLSEGEMLRVGVGPVGGGGGGTGATPPARLPPDEPLEKQKRAFASTPAGLSAAADEDEFHENLIFRGLFRKRSVSLEDAGPASLGPLDSPAAGEFHSRSSPSASCDSLAGELRTDHSDGIWNESQATVLQAGEGGGMGLDTECGAAPGSPGSLAMTPSSRRKHLLLLQHQQRSSMDTDALDEELDLSDVTQPQQPLSPRICIDAPVQQANSVPSTCNERLERYSQDSAGLSPRRSRSPLGHRTSEASAASSLESCDRFSRNGTGTGNTTMTNTTTTTTSSELARTDSGRTNTDLSETSEDYVTADGNSHTDTAGYVAWPVGTPVSAAGGVGAAGAGAGRRGEGDGSSFESGSSLYSVPAAAEETSSELQTTTTPTPLVDSEDNGDADATRAGSSTPRVSVDMGYGALRLMANSPSDESSSSSGSYSVEGSRDDLDKMLDQHPLSPVQNHNSSNHSNHSNHAGDDHEEVEARAVAGVLLIASHCALPCPKSVIRNQLSLASLLFANAWRTSKNVKCSEVLERREWTEEERRRRKKTFRLDFSPLSAGPHTDWDSPPSTGSRTTPDGWRRGGTPPGAPTQPPSATSTAPRRSKVAQAHRRQAKKCLAAGMVRSPAMHEGFRADDWAAPLQRSTPGHSPPEGAAPGGGNGGGAGAAVAGGGTSDESSGRQEAAGAGPAAGVVAGATPSGSSPRRVRRIRERKAGGRSPTQASSRLSPLRYTRSPAGSPSRRRRSKGSPSRNAAAAAGADAKGVASPEAQRLKALSAESLRSVSPGSDSVFYSEAGELSSNTMTAATDTAAGVVCHHCGREVAVLSGPEELESTAADGPSPDIVQPPAGFADSPEGPRQQAQQQQQQQPRLYKKADRRFRSEERHGERRHAHSTGRYRCDGARAKSEERGRGREDRVRLRPLARSTDASMETLRAGDAPAAAEDAGPPDGAPAAPPAEGDEDAGVYAETYKKATWIYIGETEEVHVWQKPESKSQDKDDKASDGTSERRDSLESTISERDFRRKYQAITHRMVHRKATVEMYRRLANDSFADPAPAGRTSLRRNLEELLKTMLRVWAKQVVAVSVTGGRPCDCDKTVVVRRQSGEFGFRIHGSKPVVVSAIEPDTPAESSGLEVGDIVITVNGHDVLDASHSEVVKLAHAAGSETLKLGVARTANVLTPVLREPGAGKALYSGFLWRLGGAGGTTWVRRWFSLKRDNCLYYYKTDAESLPLGALMLHRYAASRCEAAGRQHCLQLARKAGLGLTLAADSEEALTRWLAVLSHAIERNNHADEWLEATQRALRLPASSVLQPDCAGYLTQIGPKWRRRFCVLKDACLYFYQDSTADSAIGMACLHGYRVQNCGTGEKRLSFEVLPPDARQRHFYFHAESELDKKKWLAALEYSIDRWIRVG